MIEDEDEATEEETEIEDGEEGDTSFSPFDELAEEYQPSPIKKVMGADGMPQQVAPDAGKSDIPPLSCETLVCMADTSLFVKRNQYGEVHSQYAPDQVVRKPNGKWYYRAQQEEGYEELQEVEPIRPACRHYVRQLTQFDLNPEQQKISRLCAARRTTEGTFMSVRDRAVWACTMREPQGLSAGKLLDDFDDKKIAEGKQRTYHSMFKEE